MDRRTFIGATAAGIVAAPLAAIAQQAAIVRRIGVLAIEPLPTQAELTEEAAPFRALGWVEGKNLLVERRYVNGRVELLRPFAEELVRLKVEIIGTLSTPAALAAKNATSTIPIVIWSAADPVGSGLVASLSRPGGNVTGLSLLGPEVDAKRLALLRELLPGLLRVGVLEQAGNPYYRAHRSEFAQACRSLGFQPIFVEVAAADELQNAVAEMARLRAQALWVPPGGVFYANRVALIAAASKYALPTVTQDKGMLAEGAFAFFAYSEAEQNQRYASFVDRILRGAKPAELPMEQPTKFELGINLKTAKALGITVPKPLLLRADEVIQ
jgi:putative tryptophan/tyrosine transport system substrate-binding protein